MIQGEITENQGKWFTCAMNYRAALRKTEAAYLDVGKHALDVSVVQ